MAETMSKSRFRKSLFMDNWDRQKFYKFCTVNWSKLQKHEINLFKNLSLDITKYVHARKDVEIWKNMREIGEFITVTCSDPTQNLPQAKLYGEILITVANYSIMSFDESHFTDFDPPEGVIKHNLSL
jgi:hypothetical protein